MEDVLLENDWRDAKDAVLKGGETGGGGLLLATIGSREGVMGRGATEERDGGRGPGSGVARPLLTRMPGGETALSREGVVGRDVGGRVFALVSNETDLRIEPVGVLIVLSLVPVLWGDIERPSEVSPTICDIVRERDESAGGLVDAVEMVGLSGCADLDLETMPGIATPPFPNTGCGASTRVRCSNLVGSWASC